MRLASWASIVFAFGGSGTAFAETPQCPQLAEANSRLRARAEYLLEFVNKQLGDEPRVAGASGPSSFEIATILAGVIATRAKEEARIWLVQKLSEEVCDQKAATSPFFPNTCFVVSKPNDGVAPALATLQALLRRDVYALPACYALRQSGPSLAIQGQSASAAEMDPAIDPYLLEALLVGVYMRSHPNSDLGAGAPSLDPLPKDEVLARLLVGALAVRLHPSSLVKTASDASFRYDARDGTDSSCHRPTAQQIKDLVKRLLERFQGNGALSASPDAIVTELVKALKDWKCADEAKLLENLRAMYAGAAAGDYFGVAMAAAENFVCSNDVDLEKQVCKRLPLIAEVAAAKDREEMSAALDRVISPIGAWKRKQADDMWSLNAMAGVSAGYEELKNENDRARHKTMGLYMPVAVEYSWARDWGIFRSVAVGASVLDLGGVVSYSDEDELSGGETTSSSNSSLSSLTSPGIYVALGLRNSPFRLGISASRTPDLRSVDFGEGVEQNVDSKRVLIFFTVDVPLVSF
jgi:hypothetical protein